MLNPSVAELFNVNSNDLDSSESEAFERSYVIIDKRVLMRECLARCLSADLGRPIVTFSDIASWWEASARMQTLLLVISGVDGLENPSDHDTIQRLVHAVNGTPVVILSDADDMRHIADSLRCGARGYIPTNTSLNVAIEAIRFVLIGGTFIPAACILAENLSATGAAALAHKQNAVFTQRENAVIEVLRMGKTNKLIAYDLNMSESTVKVHVRNVMKKLHATNRTEAVIKISNLPS